jgi:uncharacterized protein (DUF362 family)
VERDPLGVHGEVAMMNPGQGRFPRGSVGDRITRRRFLGETAAGVSGLVAASLTRSGLARADSRAVKIVRTYHPNATTGWTTVNQGPVDMMVHAAIRELTGIGDTAMAWRSLFPGITTEKFVSIKINLACGDVPTHPQIVNSIIDGLLMMNLDGEQIPENHIIVWDNDNAFFCAQTGYQVNYGGSGVQYFGTDHAGVGFDMGRVFTISHPHNSTTSHHPSRIITQMSDYMINVGVIKDHSEAGVTLTLKNHYGSFDGVAVSQMHVSGYYGDGHSRGEPELNRVLRDSLGDKTKLWLIDSTFGLYNGGPGYTPPYHTPPNWRYNSLLAGLEPVAIDRVGTMKINEERIRNGLAALDPSHVRAAAQPPYSLGTDDPLDINLVEIDASLAAETPEPEMLGPAGLLAAYPNPTRGACILRVECREPVGVRITIVSAAGAIVRDVATTDLTPGVHRIRWDGEDQRGHAVAAGTYFCRLTAAGASHRTRITVVR